MSTANLDANKVITTLTSFIRVSIEQVWYYLEIYPKESFKLCTFYELEVYSTRHPELIAYLDELEHNLKNQFAEGSILRIYLEVYDKSYDEDKRYSIAFSFKNSLLFEQLRNEGKKPDMNNFNSFAFINELKSLLFSIINELSNNLTVKPLKSLGNFKILISTNDDIGLSNDNKWILEKSSATILNDSKFENTNLRSFRDINLGYLNIKSYIVLY